MTGLSFSYDTDAWAIELGFRLGQLEFAFGNRNFDGTELGDQIRAREVETLRWLRALVAARGMTPLAENYEEFGDVIGDVFVRLGDERLKSLALIGVATSRLALTYDVDGPAGQELRASARAALQGITSFHVGDRDALFEQLATQRVSSPAEAAVVVASLAQSPPPEPVAALGAPAQSVGSTSTVFISYARQDSDAALHLADDLERAGLDVWIDVKRIRPGQRWRSAVSEGIEQCRYFIALLSSNSVEHKGYVQAELREALELLREYPESETFVIPVRLDDADVTIRELKQLSWVDLFPDWNAGLRSLLSGLGAGSAPSRSRAFAQMDVGELYATLLLGWQLARYELIQGSEIDEARAAEPEARANLELLLEQRGETIGPAGAPARGLIDAVLTRSLARGTTDRGALLIGIAAFRATLVGSSDSAETNEELRRLAFSALLDIDPSVVPNKEALLDQLLTTKPNVSELMALLRS